VTPARPPRPVIVHWLVDSVIAFCVIAVVALFWGVGIWTIVIVALALGAGATPFTRRAEERALATRDDENPDV